jgi:hypothetical protein
MKEHLKLKPFISGNCCSAKCAGTFAWKNHTKLERPPEFYAWKTMIARCKNPNRHDWDRYGGRGITVCERWLKYENFAQDMGPRPSADHSIERRENNGNYEPSNCYWATREEQGANKRNNVLLTLGNETLNLAQWSRRVRVGEGCLRKRMKRGWPDERVLTTPLKGVNGR